MKFVWSTLVALVRVDGPRYLRRDLHTASRQAQHERTGTPVGVGLVIGGVPPQAQAGRS